MNANDHARRRSLRRWATISGIALGCAFLGVLVSAVVTAREAQSVRTETAHRSQLFRYNAKLRTLLMVLTEAETGQRGYLLTERPMYLEPYRNAVSKAPALLASLQPLPVSD